MFYLVYIAGFNRVPTSHTQVRYWYYIECTCTYTLSNIVGNIVMYLTSPMGTKSMILSKRPKDDDSKEGFTKWPFMTTHSWAERPAGRFLSTFSLSSNYICVNRK